MSDWKFDQMIKASGWPLAPQALAAGADFHARLEGGLVPLHWACREGKVGLLKHMLEHGADVLDAPTPEQPLLALALSSGSFQTVMLLIDQLKAVRAPLPDPALQAQLIYAFKDAHTEARNRLQQSLKDWARKVRPAPPPSAA
jgi:ankyrin repeat protein